MTSETFKPDMTEEENKATKTASLVKARAAKKAKAEAKTPEATEDAKPDKYAVAAARRADKRAKFEKSGFLPGQQLLAEKRPGFERRWVNDDKGKVARRENKGYTFVEEGAATPPFEASSTDSGTRISMEVGTKKGGQPLRAYLMETPEEFYQEDQQEKARRISAKARAASTDPASDSPGAKPYIPEGGSQFKLSE